MKHKILVVEDEQDTADLLKRVLEQENFSVLQAKDGRQASALVGTIRPPSLVLLDLVLPYVSGTELLKILRHDPDWKPIPIIMLSADSYEPDIQRVLNEGATAYVTKQKGSEALLQEVKRVLAPSQHTSPAATRPGVKKIAKSPRKQRPPAHRRPRTGHGKTRAA